MSKFNFPDNEYVVSVWFERDRQYVGLETPNGDTVFDLWDDDVDEAIEDGFLTTPRSPRSSEVQWRSHIIDYARDQGLIV